MRKYLSFVITISISLSVFSQKTSYRSYSHVALLQGQAKTAFQLTTTHGLEFGSYFAGLGAGLDEYRKWSLPLFFTASKY
ncbi:MAG: hypothetical protein EOO01_34985, partial [Chitinophagaceae bacterium]